MPSIPSHIVAMGIKRFKARHYHPRMLLKHMRSGMERFMGYLPAPRAVEVEKRALGGLFALVVRPKLKPSKGKMLYFHGGGYAMGSAFTHWKLAGHLAKASGLELWLPEYRLAPEHPYPAGAEDAYKAWMALEEMAPGEALFIGGDSAGGGLALNLLYRLWREEKPLPQGSLLMSPWCDLSGPREEEGGEGSLDPVLDKASTLRFAGWYAGEGLHLPGVSPLYEEAAPLGRVLMQVGGRDLFYGEVLAMERLLRRGGSKPTLEVYPGMFHVFQMGAGLLPESNRALRSAGKWVELCLQESRKGVVE